MYYRIFLNKNHTEYLRFTMSLLSTQLINNVSVDSYFTTSEIG